MELVGIRYWKPAEEDLGSPSTVTWPIRPGLTVLYGQNGAGKTTQLQMVTNALLGKVGRYPVELHLRLSPEYLSPWLQFADPVDKGSSAREGSIQTRMVNYWTERSGQEISYTDLEAMAGAILAAGRVCLVPEGVHSPRWQVWLTADLQAPVMEPWARELEGLREELEFSFHQSLEDYVEERGPEYDDFPEDEVSQLDFKEQDIDAERDRLNQHPAMSGFNQTPFVAQHLDVPASGWWHVCDVFPAPLLPHSLEDGLPIPVCKITTVGSLPSLMPILEGNDEELNVELVQTLRKAAASEYHGSEPVERIKNVSQQLSDVANSLYEMHLLDPPAIGVRLKDEADWIWGDCFAWRSGPQEVRDRVTDDPWWTELKDRTRRRRAERLGVDIADLDLVRFEYLSAAQGRWARMAALLATHVLRQGHRVPGVWPITQKEEGRVAPPKSKLSIIVVDEPEAHLHRTAEAHTASGLKRLAEIEGTYILAATHSPQLLDTPGAHVLWVDNGEVKPFDGASPDRLTALGLTPSDLLGITRGILLVEGLHDELILTKTIGDELRRSNTFILPLHGGAQLAGTVDSQVLFTYTNATLIGLLDNLSKKKVNDVWEQAYTLASGQSLEVAIRYVKEELPASERIENKYMRQWMIAALQTDNRHRRLVPWGLEHEDIVEYLPAEAFVKNKTWMQLRDRYTKEKSTHQSKGNSGKRFPDFKTWVAKTFKTDFETGRILEAVQMLKSVPKEFLDLAHLCRNLPEEDIRRATPPAPEVTVSDDWIT